MPRPSLSPEQRAYWRAFNRATARWCADHTRANLPAREADQLRYQWHADMDCPASTKLFGHDDFSVAIQWFSAFALGGPVAAAALDCAAVRAASQRARYLWIIDHKSSRAYCEPMIRAALHLAEFERVDWDTVPVDTLFEIARSMNDRARGLSRHGRAQNRLDQVPF
jgi:hypothetical protein